MFKWIGKVFGINKKLRVGYMYLGVIGGKLVVSKKGFIPAFKITSGLAVTPLGDIIDISNHDNCVKVSNVKEQSDLCDTIYKDEFDSLDNNYFQDMFDMVGKVSIVTIEGDIEKPIHADELAYLYTNHKDKIYSVMRS